MSDIKPRIVQEIGLLSMSASGWSKKLNSLEL